MRESLVSGDDCIEVKCKREKKGAKPEKKGKETVQKRRRERRKIEAGPEERPRNGAFVGGMDERDSRTSEETGERARQGR